MTGYTEETILKESQPPRSYTREVVKIFRLC